MHSHTIHGLYFFSHTIDFRFWFGNPQHKFSVWPLLTTTKVNIVWFQVDRWNDSNFAFSLNKFYIQIYAILRTV